MKQFINYCTYEQRLNAFKLGAPIEIIRFDMNGEDYRDRIPVFEEITTQQMIGWLRNKENVRVSIDCAVIEDTPVDWHFLVSYGEHIGIANFRCADYNKAELTAIDSALDYLEKGK